MKGLRKIGLLYYLFYALNQLPNNTEENLSMIRNLLLSLVFLINIFNHYKMIATDESPRLTVVIVIDQFAYQYLRFIQPYLHYGLKQLLDGGIEYTNAYFPHGTTTTATGHAGLNTGTYAQDHGFIGNRWINNQNKEIKCDDDNSGNAAVFDNPKPLEPGKSAVRLMVDGLSDQFVLNAPPQNPNHDAYSISLKSRAAIATAGKLGKAIWFDINSTQFTSSHAYFEQLPNWLITFNKKMKNQIMIPFFWPSCYPIKSVAYANTTPATYQFTEKWLPRINTLVNNNNQLTHNKKNETFLLTPAANQMLFNFALTTIGQEFSCPNNNKKMLLWLCLSSLDKLGHYYGPQSLEAVDMIYHLDRQLSNFITIVQQQLGADNVLFVLTADHGVTPIPELMQQKGYTAAQRISPNRLVQESNQLIEKKFGIKNLIVKYQSPQFFLNKKKLKLISFAKRTAIKDTIKKYLQKQPGVKQVWTLKELKQYSADERAQFLQKQIFKGRSGQITVLFEPYCLDTDKRFGTDHRAPYEYNTHVPLAFYWPGHLEQKKINTKVWMLQLANSLAELLHIQKPSASVFEKLPGLSVPFKDQGPREMPADLAPALKNSPAIR